MLKQSHGRLGTCLLLLVVGSFLALACRSRPKVSDKGSVKKAAQDAGGEQEACWAEQRVYDPQAKVCTEEALAGFPCTRESLLGENSPLPEEDKASLLTFLENELSGYVFYQCRDQAEQWVVEFMAELESKRVVRNVVFKKPST